MPELPDITLYLERLEPRVVGQVLERVRLPSPLEDSLRPPLDKPIKARGSPVELRTGVFVRRAGPNQRKSVNRKRGCQ